MKLLVSALEPSSNLHLKEVLKYTEDVELLGIFDKALGEPLYDISEMAIMGVVDAIKKLRWFFKVADEMVELAAQADKVLLMDSSGFNLPLAKKLKRSTPKKRSSTTSCLRYGQAVLKEQRNWNNIVTDFLVFCLLK